jgi:Asp-tRNA(Asn)/Glu-tRNA(Gln) amidotransferase A subunit family amidase
MMKSDLSRFQRRSQQTAAETRAVCTALSPQLNAFVEILPATQQPASHALAGVPMAIKDMVDIAGRASTLGLIDQTTAQREVSQVNASVVEKLRSAGIDLVATTKMTPLAYEPSGSNQEQGRPNNPWSRHYICGGSSSGSAVAVASGCVTAALGSDTGGSLRIPAHCCGIAAWKPSYGLVPTQGTMPLAPSLDTIGFLAREASVLSQIASVFLETGGHGPIRRVLLAQDLVSQSDAEVAAAVMAMQQTIEGLGIPTGALQLDALLKAADPFIFQVLDGEAGRPNAQRVQQGRVTGSLAARLRKGLAIPEDQLEAARHALRELARTRIAEMFGDADAILLPVMPCTTPLVEQCEPGSPTFSGRALYQLSQFTRFVNGLGLPAVALPAGFDCNGMPIGVQLVGRPGSDGCLLALAERIQGASAWHAHVPTSVREFWSRSL